MPGRLGAWFRSIGVSFRGAPGIELNKLPALSAMGQSLTFSAENGNGIA